MFFGNDLILRGLFKWIDIIRRANLYYSETGTDDQRDANSLLYTDAYTESYAAISTRVGIMGGMFKKRVYSF